MVLGVNFSSGSELLDGRIRLSYKQEQKHTGLFRFGISLAKMHQKKE